MREADDTDLDMYLKVLAQAARNNTDEDDGKPATKITSQGKKPVIELRRGTIDQFWG